MEKKNPLEEIRSIIIHGQSFGGIDEFSKMGVSCEILQISDAIDKFYEINRSNKTKSNFAAFSDNSATAFWDDLHQRNFNSIKSFLSSSKSICFNTCFDILDKSTIRLQRVKELVCEAGEPLTKLKKKLPAGDSICVNLSSLIASIAISDIVSIVNSYQNSLNEMGTIMQRLRIRNGFNRIVLDSIKILEQLATYDMTQECVNNYETNKKTLLSICNAMVEDFIAQNKN